MTKLKALVLRAIVLSSCCVGMLEPLPAQTAAAVELSTAINNWTSCTKTFATYAARATRESADIVVRGAMANCREPEIAAFDAVVAIIGMDGALSGPWDVLRRQIEDGIIGAVLAARSAPRP